MDLNSLSEKLKPLLGNNLSVSIAGYKVDLNKDNIFANHLISKTRLNSRKFSVSCNTDQTTIINAVIEEFPSCCGKAILHQIYVNSSEYTIPNNVMKNVAAAFLQYIKEIIDYLGYSSYDMILSEIDNKRLYGAVESLNFKSVYSFKNKRYSHLGDHNPHMCHNYCIDV